jgi:hypothetical protein
MFVCAACLRNKFPICVFYARKFALRIFVSDLLVVPMFFVGTMLILPLIRIFVAIFTDCICFSDFTSLMCNIVIKMPILFGAGDAIFDVLSCYLTLCYELSRMQC